MRAIKWGIIALGGVILFGVICQSCSDSSSTSKSDEDFKRKYIFTKALDETAYKDLGGIFHKVEIGTTKRIEITLDMRNRMAYGVAKELIPKMREVGFEVLRIKDKNSDRYEDINL